MRMWRSVRSVLLAVVLGFVAFAAPQPASALSAPDFIAKTYQWAQAEERTYGVPASVSLAQSMLESGMGESELAKNANAWFGIKCSSTESPHQNGCYSISTWEVDANGNRYTTTAKFRKYDAAEKSFIDHGYFLSRLSRYAKAFNYKDNPDRFIYEVHMGGYATDPQYANKVINLMERHNLYQYNVTPPASGAAELVIRPATRANVGATAHVTGLLGPGAGGRKVWTQALTPSGWSTSQTVTAGSRGQFSIPLTYGANSVGVTKFRVQASAPQGTLTSAEFSLERLGSVKANAVEDVFVGETARLTGTASGYAGRTVKAQVLVSGSWRDHSSAAVGSDGSFNLPLTHGQSSAGTTTYRASLTTAAGTTITSNNVTSKRIQPVSVAAYSAGTKAVGHETYTWGTATGAPNAEVWTEVMTGGSWGRSQTRTTDGSGGFSIPLTYGATTPGTYTFRVGVRSPLGVYYSDSFTLTRVPEPTVTAASAGSKPIGQDTYTWGTAEGAPNSPVWTEVLLSGSWARSQVGTTDANGRFTLPLTYGARTPGEYQWRVVVGGSLGRFASEPFTLVRTEAPVTVTAASAGTKPVGQTTYTWGTAAGAPNATVWTEVLLDSGWSRSQVRTTNDAGGFTIPLTYGSTTVGTYRWRVAVATADGTFRSNEFTLQRTRG